jgi:UDP-N-acetylglucosamine enolpyruvyl transferase
MAKAALDSSLTANAEADGTASINEAAGQPEATALSEFLAATSKNLQTLAKT